MLTTFNAHVEYHISWWFQLITTNDKKRFKPEVSTLFLTDHKVCACIYVGVRVFEQFTRDAGVL